MNENYRDEARVEHMHRAIKKIRQNLGKVDSGNFVEGNDNADLFQPLARFEFTKKTKKNKTQHGRRADVIFVA